MWGRRNNRRAGIVYGVCSAAGILLVISMLLVIQASIKPGASRPRSAPPKSNLTTVAMRKVVSDDGLNIWYQLDHSLAFQRTVATILKNRLESSEHNCLKLEPSLFPVYASSTLSTQAQVQRLQQLEQRWQRRINRLFREQQRLLESGGMAAYRVRAVSLLAPPQGVPPVVINWPSEPLKQQFSLCLTRGDNETIANTQAVTLTLSLIANQQHIQVELNGLQQQSIH